MMPLVFANIGENTSIKKINGKDEVRKFLSSLGFVVGEDITVVSSLKGNLIVNIKGSRVAIDSKLAKRIMV